MTNQIFCPKCKSEKTNSMKTQFPDGTVQQSFIKVDIIGTDLKSGIGTPTGTSIKYYNYVCSDCKTIFAIADLTHTGIIREGGE